MAESDGEVPMEAVWVSSSMGAAPPAQYVPVHLQVYGEAGSSQLALLAGCAQYLHRRRPNFFLRAPHVLPLYEAEWSAFVDNLRKVRRRSARWRRLLRVSGLDGPVSAVGRRRAGVSRWVLVTDPGAFPAAGDGRRGVVPHRLGGTLLRLAAGRRPGPRHRLDHRHVRHRDRPGRD